MDNVMLDLETMGTGPDAAIISIGATFFDVESLTLGERFYASIKLHSNVEFGRKMDASTVVWWMGQSDEARKVFTDEKATLLNFALVDFTRFFTSSYPFTKVNDIKLWGNGSDFDNVLLAEAYRSCRMEPPWKFYNNRCYRTMKKLRPDVAMIRTGTHHNALDDAISQANHLLDIYGVLRK